MTKKHRSYSKTDFFLDKVLWRWEKGFYDEAHVSNFLNQKIDDLAAARRSNFNDKRWILERYHKQELSRYGYLMGEMKRNIGRAEFIKTIEQIKEAEDILKKFDMVSPIIEHYDSVQKLIRDLKEQTVTGLFDDFPTIRIIFKLQEKTRLYLEEKKPQKAKLNLFFCGEEIKLLTHSQNDARRALKLKEKTKNVERILVQIHSLESPGRNKKKDFSMIKMLKKMIDDNYLELAQRLLEELELQVSDRILFFSVVDNITNISTGSKSKSKRETGKTIEKYVNYWDNEAKYRLQRSLKINLNHLRDINNQVNKMID